MTAVEFYGLVQDTTQESCLSDPHVLEHDEHGRSIIRRYKGKLILPMPSKTVVRSKTVMRAQRKDFRHTSPFLLLGLGHGSTRAVASPALDSSLGLIDSTSSNKHHQVSILLIL